MKLQGKESASHRDEWDLKARRHTGIQGREEPILEPEGRSVAASGNLLSIRDVKKTDDWGRDVCQQKAIYVHQNSQGKPLLN